MYDNSGWITSEIVSTKREDWLHDAELYRLQRIALTARPDRPGLVTKILYRAGRLMKAWGARLEEHYRRAGDLNVGDLNTAAAGNCR